MMIKKLIILSCFLMAIFAAGNVALADTATVNASVTITVPTLSLTNPTAIDFGGVITGSGAASIIRLDSSSNTNATPALLSGNASIDGSGQSGTLTVESNVDATLDVSCTDVTGQDSTSDMLETFGGDQIDFTASNVTTNTPSTLTVTANTPTTLYIGGLISVDNDDPAGSYSGVVTIDVSYP